MFCRAPSDPAWFEINLASLRKNILEIKKRIGTAKLCFPVKANAYGHGLVPIAKFAESNGVDSFAVATLREAVLLRNHGIQLPIIILGAIHEDQIDELLSYDFQFSISSLFKANLVLDKAKGRFCQVHLEVDTGMQRTGMRPETVFEVYQILKKHPNLKVVGIYSHLVSSDGPQDNFVYTQLEKFLDLKKKIQEPITWHLANSGGVYHYPETYFDMVRPGLLLYGLTPNGVKDSLFHPILSLKAKVSFFKVVPKGTGISYGHLYQTKEQTRIITVPVGYGDGYPRALTNIGSILSRGRLFTISGRVCMDQFMVDIGHEEVWVGEEVTLIDNHEEINLWDIAKKINTDPREILCRFNERIPRYYC
jgi:alanine racemase